MHFPSLDRVRWGRALAAVLISECVLIGAAFAWVAVYSHLLHPNETLAVYQQYARHASPWVSLLCGIPVFFVAARWTGTLASALAMFGFYNLVEIPMLVLADRSHLPLWFAPVNICSKFVACYAGGARTIPSPILRP